MRNKGRREKTNFVMSPSPHPVEQRRGILCTNTFASKEYILIFELDVVSSVYF